MRFEDFLAAHPVFRVEEFLAARGAKGSRWTAKAMLAHHRRQGRIFAVRRGLYAAVPPGSRPEACVLDPYLLAAKMADDAVLAYHTALEVHGRAHSVFERFFYLTRRAARPAEFRTYRFAGFRPPAALRAKRAEDVGVATLERSGLSIRATTLERTLVDLLDYPDLGGGWEEIWRSLESVEFFDLDRVVEYALLLGNATTVARVGFYLDQHRKELMVTDAHLAPLKKRRPRQPHYMERSRRTDGLLASDWNLVVPTKVAERSWEEGS
jgi:predicted transcriptional regulator of viral defense system